MSAPYSPIVDGISDPGGAACGPWGCGWCAASTHTPTTTGLSQNRHHAKGPVVYACACACACDSISGVRRRRTCHIVDAWMRDDD